MFNHEIFVTFVAVLGWLFVVVIVAFRLRRCQASKRELEKRYAELIDRSGVKAEN